MGKKGCGHHKEIFFELSFIVTRRKVKFSFYQHYFLTHSPTASFKSGKGSGHFPVSSNQMWVKISPTGEDWSKGHKCGLKRNYEKVDGSEYT